MNKEEIEEINELNIDLTDVDELDIGLEIISYKARKTIQELVDTILKLQSQLTKSNNKIEKIKEYVENDKDFDDDDFEGRRFQKGILSIIDGSDE